jgi:CO/xanthine dehydrogenase Mo-binding subunit
MFGHGDFTIFAVAQATIAIDRTRYVSEPVALVVADSVSAARAGAEPVDVDYQPLPAVARASDAIAPGAPLV